MEFFFLSHANSPEQIKTKELSVPNRGTEKKYFPFISEGKNSFHNRN